MNMLLNYIKNYVIDTFHSDLLELRGSKLGGNGIFTKTFIPKGTILKEKVLIEKFTGDDGFYHWMNGVIIDGIGFMCNGSCPEFEKYPVGSRIGPYISAKINIREDNGRFIRGGIAYFKTTEDIYPNQELILDYSDRYFFKHDETGFDYSTVRCPDGTFIKFK